nr:MAG TPA: hypothetical protein [Inoviridae sp.]
MKGIFMEKFLASYQRNIKNELLIMTNSYLSQQNRISRPYS